MKRSKWGSLMSEFDNLDGFEMKPITSGLGFHKKSSSFKSSMKSVADKSLKGDIPTTRPDGLLEVPKARTSGQIVNEIKDALKPFSESKKSETIKMTETLPRTESAFYPEPSPEMPATPAKDPIENIDFRIPKKELNERQATQRGASDAMIREWKPVSFNIAAALLDATMTLALSMIFLVGLISATNVDVLSVMLSAQTDMPAQLSLLILYLAMSQMYLIVSRSFAGASIGEWTFDIQLGQPADIPKATYPIRVLIRSFVTLLTGVVLLPLLSLILRKDLAGKIAGVRLYRRNT